MSYHAAFDLDLPLALQGQLVDAFDRLEEGVLDEKTLGTIKPDQGVYNLFLRHQLVYVGKADSLRNRLRRHFLKISGRTNIAIGEMGFKCLYVGDNWTPLAPEEALITYFKARSKGECEWNGNGFGPNDPGRKRDETEIKEEHFDGQFPIRHDFPCDWIVAGSHDVLDVLVKMKDNLPFLLRYERERVGGKEVHYTKGHPDYRVAKVTLPDAGMPAHRILAAIVAALPTGWQATRFPHQLLLYKEKGKTYPHGKIIAP